MPQVKKVLYPLELSPLSPAVAPWVEAVAQQWSAELHVLHVVPGLEFWGMAYASEALVANDLPLLVEKARPLVEEFCVVNFRSHRPAVVAVASGGPAHEIIGYASQNAIDLIVMGTHSQAGLDRALFGSVADKVLRSTTVPVLIVPPGRS